MTEALLADTLRATDRPLFVTDVDAIAWLREDADSWEEQATLRPGVVSAFLEANAPESVHRDAAWLGELGVGVVDGEAFAAHFTDRTLDEAWDHMLRGPPECTVVVTLSAPGFSDDGSQALMSVGASRGVLNGRGGLYLLEKVDGRWTVVRTLQMWVS